MHFRLLSLLSLFICLHAVHADDDRQSLSEQSREIIGTFADRLRNELQQAMSEGGPINAIDVCKVRAPLIAAELSTDGWLVRRTSLKVRNPLNAPDEFEQEILKDFKQKKAEGWSIERLAYYKMKEYGETTEFRYMKAIPTRSICLTCHGENIPPAVEQKLNTEYPADKARGYREGDIRGAFSLRKRFHTAPSNLKDNQVHNASGQTVVSRP